jgi:hypothetical protein
VTRALEVGSLLGVGGWGDAPGVGTGSDAHWTGRGLGLVRRDAGLSIKMCATDVWSTVVVAQ